MADNVLKIKIPSFDEPNGDDGESFLIKAEINGEIVGSFIFHSFDRFNFIDQTEYAHEDFSYFARRLELYARPYLNDDGLLVLVISNLVFDESFDDAYKIAFLRDATKGILERIYDDIADVYAISLEDDKNIFELSGFELLDEDELYGTWFHYISE